MNAWLISIVGIVVVGVIAELLLTDSPVAKFIKGIWGFFLLFVIVQPIPGLLRNIEINDPDFDWDWGMIGTINNQSAEGLARNTQIALASAGFENIIITIKPRQNVTSFQVETVFINASAANINDRVDIIRIVMAVTRATNDQIVFFGG